MKPKILRFIDGYLLDDNGDKLIMEIDMDNKLNSGNMGISVEI
jgi:hypothetical protein